MPRERPLAERIGMVRMYYILGNNARAVTRTWGDRFASAPPDHKTVMSNVDKFEETGSIKMRSKTYTRRVLHEGTLQAIADFHAENEGTSVSVRSGALQMGMTKSSFHGGMKEIGLKCYRPQLVVDLNDDDFDRRVQHCEVWRAKLQEDPPLIDQIKWSDESIFRMNGQLNKHNCCYWDYTNPAIQTPISNDKRGVHVWCAISSNGLIGPYFFDGTVTGESYLAMLQDFAAPHLADPATYFQQDGAPAHYARIVRDWLDDNLPNRWIGRRGPYEWPARSPDLTPCDFFLWGYLKDQVYSNGSPANIEELREAVVEACDAVPADMCARACRSVVARYNDCIDIEGKQLLC